MVSPSALAVDVGGSGVRAASVEADGLLVASASAALRPEMTPGELLDAVRRTIERARDGAAAAPIGVAVPGFVDGHGRLLHVANLPGFEGLHLADNLVDLAEGRPLHVVPDLAAAALGEARLGAGRGVERFLCVALGTGANAAMVAGGRLVETAYGCLGDAGHVNVEPDGPPCPCGGRGCLEAVASGAALRREGAAVGLADGEAVVEAAREGDPAAAAIVRRAGVGLGRAIVSWGVLTFPDVVAVAGGVAGAGELLLEPAREEVMRLGPPYVVKRLKVVPAALGAQATLVGAGVAAMEPAA